MPLESFMIICLITFLVAIVVAAKEVHFVRNQVQLYNKISDGDYGNSTVSNCDMTVISEGVYRCSSCPNATHSASCGTCADSELMFNVGNRYWGVGLYGRSRCENDSLGCQLDGEGMRSIMITSDIAGGTLTFRGLHFYRGYGGGRGGLATVGN